MAHQISDVWQEEETDHEQESSARLLGGPNGEPSGQYLPWRSVVVLTAIASLSTLAAMSVPGRHSARRGNPSAGIDLWGGPVNRPRKGSFLVLGDWGWDPLAHGNTMTADCQRAIGFKMAEKASELGDVKFVINVGDSFYPQGVANKSDPQWQAKWRDVYPEVVRSIPWYSIYGNHDFRSDPCACSDKPQVCAQINADASNLEYFYMPALSWFKEHVELGVEVVGLDLQHYMWGWKKDTLPAERFAWDCQWTPCPYRCKELMQARSEQAFNLFFERLRVSPAKNLLVFSHYPTDYFDTKPEFIQGLSDASKHHIEYFAGHRHNVDQNSTNSTFPNNNWLVGGGGGWGCEEYLPQNQGFVVGEIADDLTIATYSVLVDTKICCPPIVAHHNSSVKEQ